MRNSAIALYMLSALPAGAESFSLQPPLACDLQNDCFIQQYVDHDPASSFSDFTCGPLSYDGHKGTDFALPSLERMAEGVDVLAAATGTVVAIRDGVSDVIFSGSGDVDGRECGNGVLLHHPGGWETQYCHMKEGSVIVAKGQSVEAGAVLGEVGLSGKTQFPHLHLSVRKNGQVIDPFAPESTPTCGTAPYQTLWATPLPYEAGGLIDLGFATGIPEFSDIKAGTAALPEVTPDATALMLWAYAYGSQSGDKLLLAISGPDGTWFENEVTLEKGQAEFFRAGGKKIRAPLPAGEWTGSASLLRNGTLLETRSVSISVR